MRHEHWDEIADPTVPLSYKLAVLTEELGEIAAEVNRAKEREGEVDPNLRVELIQVGAIVLRWLESLDVT